MNIDGGSLLASMLVSSVGFVIFEYGRRMRRPPQLAVGLVLLVFPYFVANVLAMLAIGVVLVALLWIAVMRGM